MSLEVLGAVLLPNPYNSSHGTRRLQAGWQAGRPSLTLLTFSRKSIGCTYKVHRMDGWMDGWVSELLRTHKVPFSPLLLPHFIRSFISPQPLVLIGAIWQPASEAANKVSRHLAKKPPLTCLLRFLPNAVNAAQASGVSCHCHMSTIKPHSVRIRRVLVDKMMNARHTVLARSDPSNLRRLTD